MLGTPIPDLPFPETDAEFWEMFPDEDSCVQYLIAVRWPGGFCCPEGCHAPSYWREDKRAFQCADGHLVYVTAGTIMHKSKTPIRVWFWAAYILATHLKGMSARQFWKRSEIKKYDTAFLLFHKLRSGMVDPDRTLLAGQVEVDETFVGGRKPGKPGRGAEGKAIVVGAAELAKREKKKGNAPDYYVNRVRLWHIEDASMVSLHGFIFDNIDHSATILTDGWPSYGGLEPWGYTHVDVSEDPDLKPGQILPYIHNIFGQLKRWINGIHHGVSEKHLQTYLNEFAYRFSSRFEEFEAWGLMLQLAVSRLGPTYRDIYDMGEGGEYMHIARLDEF